MSGPLRVLLVEDDEDDFLLTRALLDEISRAESGQAFALDWINEFQAAAHVLDRREHDVYLIDVRLGAHSGLELLQHAQGGKCSPPVILLTGQGDREVDVQAMRRGAADYLIKGETDAAMLDRAIRYAIERNRVCEGLRLAGMENNRLAAAIKNLQTGVLITDANVSNPRITFCNPAACAIAGYDPAEMLGRNPNFLQGDRTDSATVRDTAQAIREQRVWSGEVLNYRKDGTPFWNAMTITPVFDADHELINFVGLMNDVTEARENRERYALAAAAANDGLWDWSLERDEIYFSRRWKAMLGLGEDAVFNARDNWLERVHPDDRERVRLELDAHLNNHSLQFQSEHRIRHADDTYRFVANRGLAVRDTQGRPTRMVGAQADITERKVAEEQLLFNAFYDPLTQLPNRALFMDPLGHALISARRRDEYRFAVLFLDLDRFKVVNDSLGHTVGDLLLVEVARRLKTVLRAHDTFARLGGDEFTILMDGPTSLQDADRLARRIHQELAVPLELNHHEVFPSASIGIAFSDASYGRPEDILRDADIAMYRAKAAGKSRHEVFDPAMHQSAVNLLRTEADMRRALERGEWELFYQPIISLESNALSGFEALVRWNHPERGMISPAEFIPIAEDTGLIVPLGEWVLGEACRQAVAWTRPEADSFTMAVNISSKQFSHPDLVEKVRLILEQTGLDPHRLKLEITESVIMENALSAAAMLRQLQELDVQFSIDDFGTGYSSLSSLQQFPLNTLKVDRSFVDRLDSAGENSAIVRTIVALAANLGMNVVAEGIETGEQLDKLRALNCEFGQGYLFSKPLRVSDAETLLRNGVAARPAA